MSANSTGLSRHERKTKSQRKAPTDDRLVLTVEEAGRALGLSRGSAYLAANSGALPTVRIGRRLLVPKVALQALLAGAAPAAEAHPRA
jgi:excisionase family DNA binding protein